LTASSRDDAVTYISDWVMEIPSKLAFATLGH